MKTIEELKKNIENEYSWFVNENNGCEPNIAYVKIQWYDSDKVEDNIETIVIDDCGENGVSFIADEDVLYYCSNLESFIGLIEDDMSSDFRVVELIGFEKC